MVFQYAYISIYIPRYVHISLSFININEFTVTFRSFINSHSFFFNFRKQTENFPISPKGGIEWPDAKKLVGGRGRRGRAQLENER